MANSRYENFLQSDWVPGTGGTGAQAQKMPGAGGLGIQGPFQIPRQVVWANIWCAVLAEKLPLNQ
jgi:hypothetical protein